MSDGESRREFVDKKALVTGGSRGIGRAVCLELARRGADVAFIYHSRDVEAEATAGEIRALGRVALALKTDLADAHGVGAAIDRAAAEFGLLDILVQAAGAMGNWQETAELSTDDWDRYVAVDLSGAFYVIRATLPHLRKAGGGAIVAISSIAAQMCQARNVQGAAAKAGLEAIVRVVAREEGRRGIRANAVAVGLTDTEMARTAFAGWGAESTDRVVRAIPLRRIGTPEEVARVVCFLAGPDAAYITGKVLQVDGGQIIAA
ncbi:MAG TPA: SDR family NAD(P)-dependent oxidoreductase [Steroidobacteraceae bacterium]|jgi:NAD(P)-dependent dehydrogenase (short-subunit alcohol dehydrogenase family)